MFIQIGQVIKKLAILLKIVQKAIILVFGHDFVATLSIWEKLNLLLLHHLIQKINP